MRFPVQLRLQETVFACPHYDIPVKIESQIVYPSDFFQDQPKRIIQRTCSHEFDCYLLDKSACHMKLLQIRGIVELTSKLPA